MLFKCTFNGCKCKCVCECLCNKVEKKHNHLCLKCKNENKEKCECEDNCYCKHFCKYPILLHNFICICLDFEGLGTFERTNEQDIQMALIGSAMGNSIIFRTFNSFDKFTESTLENLSLGSQKIKGIDIKEFFGGSLFFSPRDVTEQGKEELKHEFTDKIKKSVTNWYNSNKNYKKYNIFGLFDDYVFAPTPSYNETPFYRTLREVLINDTIEKILKFQRHPIYKTGKEFYLNLKTFLSAVYMNEFEFLSNKRENEIKDYVNENREKAFEVCGNYEEETPESDLRIYITKRNELKLYFNKEYLSELEINFYNNKKFEPFNNLTLDDIYCSNDIQGKYTTEQYGIILNIIKTHENCFSISIKNLDDYGLILIIPKKIKDIINSNNNLCSDLFKLWNDICKTLKFKEKDIIKYFHSFISELIKRRNNNVNKWIQEITENFENLKNLQNPYSPLDNKWIICTQQCKYCFLTCCKLQGHDNHECPYDHKCKELCSICQNCKCIEKNCINNICSSKLGHSGNHNCNHMHQCKENCKLSAFTKDCKGRCILEYNHKEEHNCDIKIHHCKEYCNLKDKAINCGEICTYEYWNLNGESEHEHNCGNVHYCKEECAYKGKSSGCKELCSLEYGHEIHENKNIHICKGEHYCIEDCYLKDKARNCEGKCIYPHPHEGKEHNCGNIHYCNFTCYYLNKSEGCKEFCSLEYGHDKKITHNCLEKHKCREKCYLKDEVGARNCGGKCLLDYPHENINHNCNNQHKCNKKCSLKDISIKCNNICSLDYAHEEECKCDLKEDHICNKVCNINLDCHNKCYLIAGHLGKHLCGQCTCPEQCKYKDCSSNCNGKCHLKGGHKEKEHLCQITNHNCKFDCCYKDKSINCHKKCQFHELEKFPQHNEESEHICEISKDNHKCSGICYLSEARGCKKSCILTVNHEGEHKCEIPYEEHLCKAGCDLNSISSKCYNLCNKIINHKGKHICSLGYDNHKCKKKCNFYKKPGEICKQDCSLKAGHNGECICEIPKFQHICSEKCFYFEKAIGCKEYCSLKYGHSKSHICVELAKNHLCTGFCYLKGKTRGKCSEKCCLSYGHKEKCKCKENNHYCDKQCKLSGKANQCKIECNKLYGHTDEHLCEVPIEMHICIEKCYYYSKFEESKKGNCNKDCCLPYGHKEKHICKYPHKHPCDQKCSLYGKCRGCNEDCDKEYMHEPLGEHLCNVKKIYIFVKKNVNYVMMMKQSVVMHLIIIMKF